MWVEDGPLGLLIADNPADIRAAFMSAAYGVPVRPGDLGFDCDGVDWRLVATMRTASGWALVFARSGANWRPGDAAVLLSGTMGLTA